MKTTIFDGIILYHFTREELNVAEQCIKLYDSGAKIKEIKNLLKSFEQNFQEHILRVYCSNKVNQ